MAEATLIQDGIDRFQTAYESFEKDLKRIQKNADKRRKAFERETEKRVKKFRTELKKNPAVKRANQLGEDVGRAIEGSFDQVLGNLRIASSGEVQKLERKVASLNRKVRELEGRGARKTRATRA